MYPKAYFVKQYQVHLLKQTLSYDDRKNVPTIAQIACFPDSPDDDFDFVSYIFVDGDTIPENYISAKKIVLAFLPARYYALYLDFLRNEKPIRFVLINDKGACRIESAEKEPVGEGPEGV